MTVPASFEKLINDVESELMDVQVDTPIEHPRNPLNVAGKVINRVAVELSTSLAEKDAEIARLKRALAGHLFDGESLNAREAIRSELIESGYTHGKRIEELEELCTAQQSQLSANSRAITKVKELVRSRDAIINDLRKLISSQNDIIAGLHAQRRTQLGQLNAAVIALLEAQQLDSVTVSDEHMRKIAHHAAGAHYAITVTHERALLQTRFEITKTGDEQ